MSEPAWKHLGINGLSPGAQLFLSTGVAAALLREHGREDDATQLEAEATPSDIVRIQDGEMHLECSAVYVPPGEDQ